MVQTWTQSRSSSRPSRWRRSGAIFRLSNGKYPRSITAPPPEMAHQIRALISARKKGDIDLDDEFLEEANIDELRKVALLKGRRSLPPKKARGNLPTKAKAIRLYVLKRANGWCEGCLA